MRVLLRIVTRVVDQQVRHRLQVAVPRPPRTESPVLPRRAQHRAPRRQVLIQVEPRVAVNMEAVLLVSRLARLLVSAPVAVEDRIPTDRQANRPPRVALRKTTRISTARGRAARERLRPRIVTRTKTNRQSPHRRRHHLRPRDRRKIRRVDRATTDHMGTGR